MWRNRPTNLSNSVKQRKIGLLCRSRSENGYFAFLSSHRGEGLRATYAVYLMLIGKLVVDILLVNIELFRIESTDSTPELWLEILGENVETNNTRASLEATYDTTETLRLQLLGLLQQKFYNRVDHPFTSAFRPIRWPWPLTFWPSTMTRGIGLCRTSAETFCDVMLLSDDPRQQHTAGACDLRPRSYANDRRISSITISFENVLWRYVY